jgi:tetratricopeptide (TPR) repeat protein
MTGKTRKQQIEEMLREDPNDPFLRYGLAMEYLSQGDLETAVQQFRDLTAVAPDYVPAYLQAGQVLVRLGRPAEAGEVWKQGIAVAQRAGDRHAAEEMQGFLDGLG